MKLDKFYTKLTISKYCVEKINTEFKNYDIILEPSAGNGSFLNFLPEEKRLGIDIEPENDEIKKINFFEFKPDKNKKYLVIGNPPFSKAVEFFNFAAEFSDCICFILPRIFKRTSILNRLNLNFHLVFSEDLPKNCFIPNMNAKCCFQIYKKSDKLREKKKIITKHKDFIFLNYKIIEQKLIVPKNTDFALKAYGSNCGYITKDINNLRPKSWHFIKSNIDIDELISRFNLLDYSISKESVRQDSLGKSDLIELYTKKFN